MRRLRPLPPLCLMTAIIVLFTAAMPHLAFGSPAAKDNGKLMGAAVRPRAEAAGTGAISGVVYFDANGDGLLGADELGRLQLAKLTLFATPGGPSLATFTTGVDGAYQFTGLDEGSYVVTATDTFGYTYTSSNVVTVNLGSGAAARVDFGNTLLFKITGVVFNDLNGDGSQAVGEPGLQSVPVQLYNDLNANNLVDSGDTLVTSTATNADGVYVFKDILPGYWVLRIMAPSGYSSPSGNQAPLVLTSSQDAVGSNEWTQNVPLLPPGAARPECAFNTSIMSGFNSTAIPPGTTVWFTARLKASGVPTSGTTIYFDNQIVQFSLGNSSYHLPAGRGKVVFETAGSSVTSYDGGTQTWTTIVGPADWGKEIFLSGLAFPVTGNIPGGLKPVSWSGRFSGTKTGVSLEWQWSAAVYTSLGSYSALGVWPVTAGDTAGTPVNYKAYVTAGARGGGGSNYTGSDTPRVRSLCISPAEPPYDQALNCGSTGYTDSFGHNWSPDRKYTVGAWGFVGGDRKAASGPVGWTEDDFLYQKYREKPVEYRFTVPDGTYNVTLKFAEFTAHNEGERAMKIWMEGTTVEPFLDIYAKVKKYTAYDATYQVTVSDGVLNIGFEKAGGSKEPIVSAIRVASVSVGGSTTPPTPPPTVAPTPTPTVTPVPSYLQFVNSGSTTYTGADGAWAGDKAYKTGSWGYTGGGAKTSNAPVEPTLEDALYQSYRENPHEYRFTVPNGTYQITLKFAEFSAANATDRLMKISIEGVVVENSMSIWTEAGGKNRSVDKTYTATVNDGVLNISFVKATGSNKEPAVSAIKVVSQ